MKLLAKSTSFTILLSLVIGNCKTHVYNTIETISYRRGEIWGAAVTGSGAELGPNRETRLNGRIINV